MKYKNGVMIGRFQPFHLGHKNVVDLALSKVDNLLILIGSAQEKGTERNPYSYEQRKAMIKAIYGDKVRAEPIFDIGVGDNPLWWDYVLKRCNELSFPPNVLFGGGEAKHASWLKESGIAYLSVDRAILPISSTVIREKMKANDESWKELVDPRILPLL